MADANTGDRQDVTSKAVPQSAPSAQAATPEPVILEETVTRPAPKAPAAPVPPPVSGSPQPTPLPSAPKIPEPVIHEELPKQTPKPLTEIKPIGSGSFIPPELKTAPAPVSAPERPRISSSALAAGAVPGMPEVHIPEPKPKLPTPPPVPLPQSGPKTSTTPPAIQTEASKPPISAEPKKEAADGTDGVQSEIANILKGVKLPERSENASVATEKKESHVFDTALGAAKPDAAKVPATPAGTAAPATPETAGEKKSITASIVSPFRTLKDDLQGIVRDKKISLVRAAALESDKRRGQEDVIGKELGTGRGSRRTFAIIFASVLLVLLGGAAFLGVYLIESTQNSPLPQLPSSSLLFAENSVPFPLGSQSSLDVKRLLAQARNASSATLGSITRIVPVIATTNDQGQPSQRPATLGEFLQALGTRTSPDLLRALGGDFFFGLHTVDKNAPVIVIPVTSYEHAFAGMLAWEATMNTDLAPVFTPVPDQTAGPGGLPQKREFQDLVMRNYDVRALKDDAGVIQLYYSFPNRTLLIIGESPYSFTEVLSRLRADRKL